MLKTFGAYPIIPALLSLLLLGCGGGGGDTNTNENLLNGGSNPTQPSEPSPANKSPVIGEMADVSVASGAEVVIEPQVSDDGSMMSFSWSQTSGVTVTVQHLGKKALIFTAPIVGEETVLTFTLQVTDDRGAQTSASVRINVAALEADSEINFADAELAKCFAAQSRDMKTQTLECDGYRIKTLEGISALSNLKRLVIKNAALESLTSLNGLSQLEVFHLDEAFPVELNSLYNVLDQLTGLKKFVLSTPHNSIISKLDFTGLTELESLNIKDNSTSPYSSLIELSPIDVANMKELYLDKVQIEENTLSQMVNLESLILKRPGATGLRTTAFLENMSKLKVLALQGYGVYFGEEIGKLSQLERLTLDDTNIDDLSFISQLNKLTALTISKPFYTDFDFNWLISPSLKELSISDLGLLNIEKLSSLTGLETLAIKTNLTTVELPELSALTNLVNLNLTGWSRFHNYVWLDTLPRSVENLTVRGIDDSEEVAKMIANLSNLKSLTVAMYYPSNLITQLAGHTQLEKLTLFGGQYDGEQLVLPNLKELNIRASASAGFPDIASLPKLESLNLSDYKMLTTLENLTVNSNLKSVSLSGLESLTNLDYLEQLPQLQTLHLDNLQAIEDFEQVGKLTSLTDLKVEFSNAYDMSPIANLTLLESLYLRQFKYYLDLDSLFDISGLDRLSLSSVKTSCDDLDKLSSTRVSMEYESCWQDAVEPNLIPDPVLKACVIKSVYRERPNVTSIHCDSDIQSLKGLEQLTGLKALSLYNVHMNILSDDVLASLTTLERVFIKRPLSTAVTNSQLHENLSRFAVIDTDESMSVDVEQLKVPANVYDVNFSNTRLVNYAALASNTRLQELYLENSDVSDISALYSLKQLGTLNLIGNNRVNCEQIDELKALNSGIDISLPYHCW
ncbi:MULTISPECIES: leucine-rich repeat domain-containing protein [Pseudoalteromonas]|uniref:PKD/Chitinase domain-containing protein n=1 Tax=Pseudoalteromonas amylolytica TaxID=1859457 RepID=A0A1S1MRD1_9GAMM|nr:MULTISPECIES: hypothetical protein [Pseudoalteromonas]OHU86493.1 hypothetical protein BFC16_13320 [Pseudoalteromonas sp. JW3]OHU88983.1 hypothetical protein BET10_19440 [Pseudoalteromonas amylolytica]